MHLNKAYLILKDGLPSQEKGVSERHIFTTARVQMGNILLWGLHEKRLLYDASQLGAVWDTKRTKIVENVAGELQNGALRVTCTPTSWWIHGWSAAIDESKALRTCWVEWEHRASLPAHVKHGERSFARQLTKDRDVDVLLWKDKNGAVLEASFGNLFSIVDGCIYTPPANGAILDGVGRRTLLHVARKIGLRVNEGAVGVERGGWWMTSALRGLQRLDISTDDDCIPTLREEIVRFLLSSPYELRA